MYLSKAKVSYMLIIESTQDHCPSKHPLLADQLLSAEEASAVPLVSTGELLLVLEAARQKRSSSHSPPAGPGSERVLCTSGALPASPRAPAASRSLPRQTQTVPISPTSSSGRSSSARHVLVEPVLRQTATFLVMTKERFLCEW